MKTESNLITVIIGSSIALVIWFAVLYLIYWLMKTFSYWLFYEDMVIQTVHEVLRNQ